MINYESVTEFEIILINQLELDSLIEPYRQKSVVRLSGT